MSTPPLDERCCDCDASAIAENVRLDLMEMGYPFDEAHRISQRIRRGLKVQLIDAGYCEEHAKGNIP